MRHSWITNSVCEIRLPLTECFQMTDLLWLSVWINLLSLMEFPALLSWNLQECVKLCAMPAISCPFVCSHWVGTGSMNILVFFHFFQDLRWIIRCRFQYSYNGHAKKILTQLLQKNTCMPWWDEKLVWGGCSGPVETCWAPDEKHLITTFTSLPALT